MKNNKKVYITGHSRGLGSFFVDYFLSKSFKVHGVSRNLSSVKHDFFSEENIDINNIDEIVKSVEAFSPDIFISNAYSGFQQVHLMIALCKLWENSDKIIINVSSNVSEFTFIELDKFSFHTYDVAKAALDLQVKKNQFSSRKLKIINLRPGLIDTQRVEKELKPKLDRAQINKVIEVLLDLLESGVYVQEMTFSPLDQFL